MCVENAIHDHIPCGDDDNNDDNNDNNDALNYHYDDNSDENHDDDENNNDCNDKNKIFKSTNYNGFNNDDR